MRLCVPSSSHGADDSLLLFPQPYKPATPRAHFLEGIHQMLETGPASFSTPTVVCTANDAFPHTLPHTHCLISRFAYGRGVAERLAKLHAFVRV